jgi:hypothetical protein
MRLVNRWLRSGTLGYELRVRQARKEWKHALEERQKALRVMEELRLRDQRRGLSQHPSGTTEQVE